MRARQRRVSFISFLIGIAAIFADVYFENIFPAKNPFNLGNFGILILYILKGIGTGAITIVCLNEVKYWIESPEILIYHGFINRLRKEELISLKEKIEYELYYSLTNHDTNDNFYKFFGTELSSLLDKPYYKSFDITVICRIDNKSIRKTITKIIEIINPSNSKQIVSIPFGVELQRVEGVAPSELYKINEFRVGSDDLKDKLYEKLVFTDKSSDEKDAYCYKFNASWDVEVSEQCSVKMEVETVVPIDDVCFSNKVTYPCKNYKMIFAIIDNPNYTLSWHSFGFLGNHSDKIAVNPIPRGVNISFKDWILSGDGVVITVNKSAKRNK